MSAEFAEVAKHEADGFDVVVESTGGVAKEAMTIGELVFRRKARVVVSNICASSCANYIFSASTQVSVLPNSYVVMHGSIPRSRFGYVQLQLSFKGITKEDLIRSPNKYSSIWNEFPSYYADEIKREDEFLFTTEVDPMYLSRYMAVKDNLRLYVAERCKSGEAVALVVGPEYYKRYRYGIVDYFWMPTQSDLLDLVKRVPGLSNYNIVIGDNLSPSWIPANRSKAPTPACKALQ